MNTLKSNITQLKLPGLEPRFDVVDIQDEFDAQSSLFLNKIWRFYNNEHNPASLINRVEIWQDKTGIALAFVFFMNSGCEQMQENYASLTPSFEHQPRYNWCKLEISNPENIRSLLFSLIQGGQFSKAARTEMSIIVESLSKKIGSFIPRTIEDSIDVTHLSKEKIREAIKVSSVHKQQIILQDLLIAGKKIETKEERDLQAFAAELYWEMSDAAQKDFLLHLFKNPTIFKHFTDAMHVNYIYHSHIKSLPEETLRQEHSLIQSLKRLGFIQNDSYLFSNQCKI